MSWIAPQGSREQLLAELPTIAEPYEAFCQSFWQLPQIPAQTLELCRLRLAQLHDCDFEWCKEAVVLAAEQRLALRDWHKSALFSEAEYACLAFSEVYMIDPQAITDAQADAVKDHYGEAGLVALVEALGVFYGAVRLSMLWQLES